MKNIILYVALSISVFGFGQTITGVGNSSTDPFYSGKLIGLPACDGIESDIFTVTGSDLFNENTPGDYLIVPDGGSGIQLNIVSTSLGSFAFELPNASVAGIDNNFYLSGLFRKGESMNAYSITVLSCPQILPTAEEGQTNLLVYGNDLNHVQSVSLSLVGTNIEYTNIPFMLNPLTPPFLNVDMSSINATVNQAFKILLNTTIDGLTYSVTPSQNLTITPPIFPPIILTVNGTSLSTTIGNNTFEITTSESNATLNIGGFYRENVSNPFQFNPFPSSLFQGRYTYPEISVFNAVGKSDTWYAPLMFSYDTPLNLSTGLGQSFDAFSIDTNSFTKVIPIIFRDISNNSIQQGVIAYDNNNTLSIYKIPQTATNKPLHIDPSPIASKAGFEGTHFFKTKDMNGDGLHEVLDYSTDGSSHKITIYKVSESGFSEIGTPINLPYPLLGDNFDMADFNNDGFNDIITLEEVTTGSYKPKIYLRIQFGYQLADPLISDFTEDSKYVEIKAIDFNRDSQYDFALLFNDFNNSETGVNLYTFDGMNFQGQAPITISTTQQYTNVSNLIFDDLDYNLDGLLDIGYLAKIILIIYFL